jgi:hypothetical protein
MDLEVLGVGFPSDLWAVAVHMWCAGGTQKPVKHKDVPRHICFVL